MKAPWPDARQLEQDLIISRALCDLFNTPMLKGKIAFRDGTAINKLLFKQPAAEQRMLEKLTRSLIKDIAPLLPAGVPSTTTMRYRLSSASGRNSSSVSRGMHGS